jgi:U3 small nucleolar RNA-associated protein 15
VSTTRIPIVVSLIDELATREGLKYSLQKRSAESLVPVLKFLAKYIDNPQYSKAAMSTVRLSVDLHTRAFTTHPELVEILRDIRCRLIAEIKLQRRLKALCGVLTMLTT